jgi:hypothetical protein
MQTFLPYPNFDDSAEVLDKRRLNKQRVEAYQILKAINNPDYGWQNHPAVNMWRGYDQALLHYALTMCQRWEDIGGADNVDLQARMVREFCTGQQVEYPYWLGNAQLHLSHKVNLYFKEPDHYGQFWIFGEPRPYFWPANKESEID